MLCPDITIAKRKQRQGKVGRHGGWQHGLSMIELLIALLIGLFLLGGLSILVQNNRRTTVAQSQLSRLQDMERVAMGLVTDMIQQAGYFPDPTSNTSASWAPAGSSNGVPRFTQGTAVFGQPTVLSAPFVGEWLYLRYATTSGDGIINCDGSTNTTVPLAINIAFYFVDNGQLTCRQSTDNFNSFGPFVPLVGDVLGTLNGISVTNFAVLYGVNSTGTSQNVDTYKNSTQIATTPADWLNIISMQITLTFTNPLYVAANPAGQPQYVNVTRVVSVMHQTGI